MRYDEKLAIARGQIQALRAALRDCATHPVNADTCGVCGRHFPECEVDQQFMEAPSMVKDPTLIRQPACAGARAREALRALGGEDEAPRAEKADCLWPRFFVDHGVLHDRKTGRHVRTDPDFGPGRKFEEDGIEQCCALLNELYAASVGYRGDR